MTLRPPPPFEGALENITVKYTQDHSSRIFFPWIMVAIITYLTAVLAFSFSKNTLVPAPNRPPPPLEGA